MQLVTIADVRPFLQTRITLLELADYRPSWAFGPFERPKPQRGRSRFEPYSSSTIVAALKPAAPARRQRPAPLSLQVEVDDGYVGAPVSRGSGKGGLSFDPSSPASPLSSIWPKTPEAISSFPVESNEVECAASCDLTKKIAHML